MIFIKGLKRTINKNALTNQYPTGINDLMISFIEISLKKKSIQAIVNE